MITKTAIYNFECKREKWGYTGDDFITPGGFEILAFLIFPEISDGASCRTRTYDLQLRRLTLYPVELRTQRGQCNT